ncbi:MAG: hypothetical protein KatS3mg016_2163 [Fimbriimonadales bacterium]|nr:MAG: hypothetical protein KatS3mg016_2163 [Fimbriimonadales bacterium]
MIEEIRAVLLFEYRRYMRARVFWKGLLWKTTFSLVAALAFYVGYAYEPNTPIISILPWLAMVVLGAVILFQMLSLGGALFDDAVEGRALPDLWLTGMTPLSLVLGRWLFAGFYALLTLVALAPALWLGALACRMSMTLIASALLVFWLSVMRLLPELFLASVQRRRAQLLGWVDSEVGSEGGEGTALALMLVMFYFWLMASGAFDAPPAMPVFLFAPPLVLVETHRVVSLGGLMLPMSVLGSAFLLGFALLGVLAILQAMDVRLLWARFWQPLLGSVLLLTLWGVSLYVYAAERVQTSLQAQTVALNSLWMGWTLYLFFQHELAFFALRRGESVHNWAHPTRRGLFWLVALWMSMGLLAPIITFAASGIPIEPARWGMTLLALGGWCAWIGSILFSTRSLHNDAYYRYLLSQHCYQVVALLVAIFVWGMVAVRWIAEHIPILWLRGVLQALLYLAPTDWVFLPDAPLWVYGVYGLYNGALAILTRRWRKALESSQG